MADTVVERLVIKLDVDTSQFSTQINTADQQVRQFKRDAGKIGTGPRVDVDTRAVKPKLEQVKKDVDKLAAEKPKSLRIDVESKQFTRKLADAGSSVEDFSALLTTSPALAAAAFAAAMVTIAVAVGKTTAEIDKGFRSVEAALPSADRGGIGILKDEILALSTVTPRSAIELSALAKQLASVGETNPKAIALDLKAIALAADALGTADAAVFVDLIDGIADSFQLTSNGAREAFVQIVALTKNKIPIEELNDAFGKGATSISRFTSNALDAATTFTTLIDANINSRKLIPGVIGLLNESEQASQRAQQAAAAGQDGSARAFEVFARTVNKSEIASKGLTTVLGNLFTALGESEANFKAVNLSSEQFVIAQRAAAAAASGTQQKADTLAEAMEKLEGAAAINNGSAAALSARLKNELSNTLFALGSTFLPPVLSALNSLANRFSDARRSALAFVDSLPAAEAGLRRIAAQGGGPSATRSAGGFVSVTDRGAAVARTLTDTREGFTAVAKTPSLLGGLSPQDLARRINAFSALRVEAEKLSKQKGVGFESSDVATLDAALKNLRERLQEVAGEEAELLVQRTKAAKLSDERTDKDKLSDQYRDQSAAAKQLAERLAAVEDSADALLSSLSESTEAEKAAASIVKWAESALAAGKTADEVQATVSRLNAALAVKVEKDDAAKTKEDDAARAKLGGDVQKVAAELAGDAVELLRVQYDDLRKSIEAYAAEAVRLNDADSAARAAAALQTLDAQKTQLIELAKLAKTIADARETEAAFAQSGNAAFEGRTATITDQRSAVLKLIDAQRTLQNIVNDPKTDPKARVQAAQQLADLQSRQLGPAKEVADEASKAAIATERVGAGIETAASAALSLVQIFGNANSELGTLLAGALNLGKGIGDIGALASKAGGFGKLFGSAGGIASALPAIGAVVGGAFSIGKSLFGKSDAEKQREQAQKAAQDRFLASLTEFIRGIERLDYGAFARARAQLQDEIRGLVNAAIEGAGGKANKFRTGGDTSDAIRAEQARLRADRGNNFVSDTIEALLRKRADALDDVLNVALRAENQLIAAQRAEVEQATADVRVRQLRLQGRGEEAAALEASLRGERALAEARKDFATTGNEFASYLGTLQSVLQLELEIANATRQREAALSLLNDRLEIFGGDAAAKLKLTSDTLAELFPSIESALAGLDLTNTNDLGSLSDRLKALFTDLSRGGIDATESPLVDAIKQLLGSVTPLIPDAATGSAQRNDFVASEVTAITQTTALRMTDFLASALIEQRATRIAAEQISGLLGALVGSRIALSAPVLPPSVSGVGGGGAGVFTLVVQINGPISGMSPEQAGRRLAEEALPYINEMLARQSGIEARNAGLSTS